MNPGFSISMEKLTAEYEYNEKVMTYTLRHPAGNLRKIRKTAS